MAAQVQAQAHTGACKIKSFFIKRCGMCVTVERSVTRLFVYLSLYLPLRLALNIILDFVTFYILGVSDPLSFERAVPVPCLLYSRSKNICSPPTKI